MENNTAFHITSIVVNMCTVLFNAHIQIYKHFSKVKKKLDTHKLMKIKLLRTII